VQAPRVRVCHQRQRNDSEDLHLSSSLTYFKLLHGFLLRIPGKQSKYVNIERVFLAGCVEKDLYNKEKSYTTLSTSNLSFVVPDQLSASNL